MINSEQLGDNGIVKQQQGYLILYVHLTLSSKLLVSACDGRKRQYKKSRILSIDVIRRHPNGGITGFLENDVYDYSL